MLNRTGTGIRCRHRLFCRWSASIEASVPAVGESPAREQVQAALALLTGDVMDGQWLGKECGVTYMLIRTSDLELARTHLYRAIVIDA